MTLYLNENKVITILHIEFYCRRENMCQLIDRNLVKKTYYYDEGIEPNVSLSQDLIAQILWIVSFCSVKGISSIHKSKK